ncbi:MAG: sigma-70 family RNA polymerase sigma factor [Anaerolineae bacterium]
MPTLQNDDEFLMKRISAGDQQAFAALYDQYGGPVYSLAYRILQNSTLAEEVTQDTFLKVWQRTSQWDSSKGKLKSWLLKITQYGAIDRLRQEHRQPSVHESPIDETDETLLMGKSDQSVAGWQDEMALRMLITQLPREQSTLIELAFFQGMTHTDIAEATHIPLGTVKTRLRTGLHRLRELWMESHPQTDPSKQP